MADDAQGVWGTNNTIVPKHKHARRTCNRQGAGSAAAQAFVHALEFAGGAAIAVERVRDPSNLAGALGELGDACAFFPGDGVLKVWVATSDAAAVALLPASMCSETVGTFEPHADSAVRNAYATPEATLVAQAFIGQPLVLTRDWIGSASTADVATEAFTWLERLRRATLSANAALRTVRAELVDFDSEADAYDAMLMPTRVMPV